MKVLMHALAASCEELRARTGNPPLANKFLHAIPFRNVNNHVNIFSEMLFFYA
jgi:hypothetical protein